MANQALLSLIISVVFFCCSALAQRAGSTLETTSAPDIAKLARALVGVFGQVTVNLNYRLVIFKKKFPTMPA